MLSVNLPSWLIVYAVKHCFYASKSSSVEDHIQFRSQLKKCISALFKGIIYNSAEIHRMKGDEAKCAG